MRFSALLAVATFVVCGIAQTVHQVEADMAEIASEIVALENVVQTFGETVTDGLTIHTTAEKLKLIIAQATNDITDTSSPLSDDEEINVIDSFGDLVASFSGVLNKIQALGPTIGPHPTANHSIFTLVKHDLFDLRSKFYAFGKALINATPAGLKAQATAFCNELDGYFGTVQRAYG